MELISKSNLLRKRKKQALSTDSRHWMKKYPHLIRGFNFDRSHLLRNSDITYMKVNGEFAHLSLTCG
ncbi:hypothetical protein EZS27_041175 [termite gut metagenome]|uniref:Uncharacterized protein n=1 Tax=termite gut metagenome TaxID=433724 RepID=A0A5J4PF72_9ZZZZ